MSDIETVHLDLVGSTADGNATVYNADGACIAGYSNLLPAN